MTILILPHKIKLEKGIERKENTPVDSMESLIEIINGQHDTTSGDLELIIDITMRGFDAMKVTVTIFDKENEPQLVNDVCDSSDIEQMTRLGEAIGISKSIYVSTITIHTASTMDPNYLRPPVNAPVNAPSYQCLQSIYRGFQSNNSILALTLDLECIAIRVNESFPRLCLQSSQFKSNLQILQFSKNNRPTLTDEDSIVIVQALETMPCLNTLNIENLASCASAFRRIIAACPPLVYRLLVSCNTAEHCSILASFLQSNRLMVNLDVFKANYSSSVGEEVSRESVTLTEQEASTIIDGLKNPHMKLKTLYIYCCKGNTYYTSVRDLLCDTSSIESIVFSNHTLVGLQTFHLYCPSPEDMDIYRTIKDCLALNRISNKNKVIREKIARYYFVGDFDISPFAGLPISVVPSVLGMINDDDALYCQSAIFRLLKSIPDLCNVGSRMKIVSNDDDDEDIDAVKDGACGNKRRRKT